MADEPFSQFIDPKYDRATLEKMSLMQNNKLELSQLRDNAGNPVGYTSLQPIDLTNYLAIYNANTKETLTVYANTKQWLYAIGGYTVTYKGQVITFPTDAEGRGLISDKVLRLSKPNAPSIVSWQIPGTTTFIDFEADDFELLAVIIGDFFQNTFDFARTDIFPKISDGSITTTEQIDALPWPVNHYTFPAASTAPASNTQASS